VKNTAVGVAGALFRFLGQLPAVAQYWIALAALLVLLGAWTAAKRAAARRRRDGRRPVTDSGRRARDEHAATMLAQPDWYIHNLLRQREGEFTRLQALARRLGDNDLKEADR